MVVILILILFNNAYNFKFTVSPSHCLRVIKQIIFSSDGTHINVSRININICTYIYIYTHVYIRTLLNILYRLKIKLKIHFQIPEESPSFIYHYIDTYHRIIKFNISISNFTERNRRNELHNTRNRFQQNRMYKYNNTPYTCVSTDEYYFDPLTD